MADGDGGEMIGAALLASGAVALGLWWISPKPEHKTLYQRWWRDYE